MSDRPKKAAAPKPSASRGGRLPQAAALKRQQKIALLHDVEHLTFARIAERVGMGEKECRLAYNRYIDEVAPLLTSLANHQKVAQHLRLLEDVVQELWRAYATADNSNAAVGALRQIAAVIKTEFELRQSVGLLPKAPRTIADEQERAWIGQQVAELLREVGAPDEALARLERILSGEEA